MRKVAARIIGTIGDVTGNDGFTGVRRTLDPDGWTSYRAFRRGVVVTFMQLEPDADEDKHAAYRAIMELEVSTYEPKASQVPVLPLRTIKGAPRVVRLVGTAS